MQTWKILVNDAGTARIETLPVRWTERGMLALREGGRFWITYRFAGGVGVPTIDTTTEAVLWR